MILPERLVSLLYEFFFFIILFVGYFRHRRPVHMHRLAFITNYFHPIPLQLIFIKWIPGCLPWPAKEDESNNDKLWSSSSASPASNDP
jgi:hypothetical protein